MLSTLSPAVTTQHPLDMAREWHGTGCSWMGPTNIHRRDQETATTEKTRIEDEQRAESSRRADEGIDWRPRLFRSVQGGPGGSEEGEEDLDWILKAKM